MGHDCTGISELFKLEDTSAVPQALVAQLNSALLAHRNTVASVGDDPYKHQLCHFLMAAG